MKSIYLLILSSLFLNAIEVDLQKNKLLNNSAYISAQCYTMSENKHDKNILHNPCYSCHTKNKAPNYTLQDDELQTAYDFPAPALKNPWTNLFKDRTKEVSNISDQTILEYISQDNYIKDNKIILKEKLSKLPPNWDFNKNGKWDGYIPDCYFQFDKEGFDKDIKGNYTGWRAFAYRPFLGTFWPTNGSTDDVIIRLPKSFQQDENGNFNIEVYKLNLAIVEALIKQEDVHIDPVDENKYGWDINKDGKLATAKKIVFQWEKPNYDLKTKKITHFSINYVGKAQQLLQTNQLLIAPGLYPVGTEFLHTVRYVGIDKNTKITLSPRMKEIRYGIKTTWSNYGLLKNIGLADLKEKVAFPDRLDQFIGNSEVGIFNQKGWRFQGFIEDKNGELRPQSYEEHLFCMGCHNNIAVTADSTFVFQRKLSYYHHQKGWYHWSQKGLQGIKDKPLKNGDTEYVHYLKVNNAGDEFRQNEDVMKKFFQKDWQKDSVNIQKDLLEKLENPNIYQEQSWKLKKEEIKKLQEDITHLIYPSYQRALNLNKAYKVIVDEQSYIYGRDPHIKPIENIHKTLKGRQMTQLEKVYNE